jgi:hypothetical protein
MSPNLALIGESVFVCVSKETFLLISITDTMS